MNTRIVLVLLFLVQISDGWFFQKKKEGIKILFVFGSALVDPNRHLTLCFLFNNFCLENNNDLKFFDVSIYLI